MTTHSPSHIPLLPRHEEDVKRLPPHVTPPLLPEHAGGSPGKGAKTSGGRGVLWVGIALVVVAGLVVLILNLVHRHRVAVARRDRGAAAAKGPKLSVAQVGMSSAHREVLLPGEVRAFNQSTLYAKVSGYLQEIHFDRGDVVKKDDVIAVIESPEMHDDVLAAESNQRFTKRNATRYDQGAIDGVTTMIQRDTAMNAAMQADADLKKARTLYAYTLVKAPFDGIVTARYVDLGALVPAATSATQQAQPVVDLAEIDRVRVFVYLGQDTATFVKPGDAVSITEDERPGRVVPAKVTRLAGALDTRTRTMQCEVDVENGEWHLTPGTFVHVRLSLEAPPAPIVSDDALVTRDGTPHVAIVRDARVHYQAVEVGIDDGISTRIESGLSGGETVGLNVPVEIEEGALVQPIAAKPDGNKPPPAPSGGEKTETAPDLTPDNAGDGGVPPMPRTK
jgi:membrane fusion protein, multidrug efflux system